QQRTRHLHAILINALAENKYNRNKKTQKEQNTMKSTKFEPQPNTPHGYCQDCKQYYKTEQDTIHHRNETNHKHFVQEHNPTRTKRINTELSTIVNNGMETIFHKIQHLENEGHVKQEELNSILTDYTVDL